MNKAIPICIGIIRVKISVPGNWYRLERERLRDRDRDRDRERVRAREEKRRIIIR